MNEGNRRIIIESFVSISREHVFGKYKCLSPCAYQVNRILGKVYCPCGICVHLFIYDIMIHCHISFAAHKPVNQRLFWLKMKMKMKANMSNRQYLRPKFGLMQMAMLFWMSKGIEEKMSFREY